jgi:hypothetical protein
MTDQQQFEEYYRIYSVFVLPADKSYSLERLLLKQVKGEFLS